MKKVLITLLGLTAFAAQSSAQSVANRYTATYSNGGTYAPLTGTASLIPFPIDWDEETSAPITVPFAFKYQNVAVNTVEVETGGTLFLNGVDSFGIGHILGYYMDYESKNRGKVYYETVGATGNRIFKTEFRNIGRYFDTVGTDTLNFQIWLYESDNSIEYRAGYSNVPSSTFAVDLNDLLDEKETILCGLMENNNDVISGDQDSVAIHAVRFRGAGISDTSVDLSVLDNSTNGEEFGDLLLGKFPPMGSVMRFAPVGGTGIAKIDFDLATVFPNPSKDGKYTITLKENLQNASLFVYDVTGKLVRQEALTSSIQTLDLSKLAAGQYLVQIKSDSKFGMFKLVKD